MPLSRAAEISTSGRAMTKLNAAYVPDEMWDEFSRGVIDHFIYGNTASVAVYADGHLVSFCSAVTPEAIAKAREVDVEQLRGMPGVFLLGPFVTTVTLDRAALKGVIVGWVE